MEARSIDYDHQEDISDQEKIDRIQDISDQKKIDRNQEHITNQEKIDSNQEGISNLKESDIANDSNQEDSKDGVEVEEQEFLAVQKYLTSKQYPLQFTKDQKRSLRRKARRYIRNHSLCMCYSITVLVVNVDL